MSEERLKKFIENVKSGIVDAYMNNHKLQWANVDQENWQVAPKFKDPVNTFSGLAFKWRKYTPVYQPHTADTLLPYVDDFCYTKNGQKWFIVGVAHSIAWLSYQLGDAPNRVSYKWLMDNMFWADGRPVAVEVEPK